MEDLKEKGISGLKLTRAIEIYFSMEDLGKWFRMVEKLNRGER